MKKTLLFGMLVCLASAGAAVADCKYTETENVVVIEQIDVVVNENRFNRPVKKYRPAVKRHQKATEPVKLKTHTEVIEHYQILQPVTVYKPVGTEVKRYVVPAKRCDSCEM